MSIKQSIKEKILNLKLINKGEKMNKLSKTISKTSANNLKNLFQQKPGACFWGVALFFVPFWNIATATTEAVQKAAEATGGGGFYALAAGLAIAIAALGGALGQGKVGAAAMEGIARNPQAQKTMFIPMIIVLALIESFVIFSLAIAMIIVGKI